MSGWAIATFDAIGLLIFLFLLPLTIAVWPPRFIFTTWVSSLLI